MHRMTYQYQRVWWLRRLLGRSRWRSGSVPPSAWSWAIRRRKVWVLNDQSVYQDVWPRRHHIWHQSRFLWGRVRQPTSSWL